jgi:hypothetical protein
MTTYDHFARFTADVEDHVMTIALDQDLYRHLKFRDPSTSMGWFDVITWPGKLTINGDMGTYTFGRLPDMFEFFGGRAAGYVNEGYWAEKLVAIDNHSPAKEFDEDLFRQHVIEDFWQQREYYDPIEARQIWAAIRDQIFDDYASRYTAHQCHDLLNNFVSPVAGFGYSGSWDWGDFDDYGVHFVWCLHAITHAIRTYREAKAAATHTGQCSTSTSRSQSSRPALPGISTCTSIRKCRGTPTKNSCERSTPPGLLSLDT